MVPTFAHTQTQHSGPSEHLATLQLIQTLAICGAVLKYYESAISCKSTCEPEAYDVCNGLPLPVYLSFSPPLMLPLYFSLPKRAFTTL